MRAWTTIFPALALVAPAFAALDSIHDVGLHAGWTSGRRAHKSFKNGVKKVQSNGLPDGWTLGAACISDGGNQPAQRLLQWSENPTNMTISSCLNICAFHDFEFAATQFGQECWCANAAHGLNYAGGGGKALDPSQCNMPCKGNSSEACGGNDAMVLYNRTITSEYSHKTTYAGSSFWNNWSFFSDRDPTGGSGAYQTASNAFSKKLAYVDTDGSVVLKVDNTTTLQKGQQRATVRISSNKFYDSGLFIFDILSMPYGCSVWPALWTVGPNWPSNGEIDILEGVNLLTHNQITFHTHPNTTCNITNIHGDWTNGTNLGPQTCASSPSADAGCGFFESDSPSVGTYGASFNAVGGAVYALKMASDGYKVWRWHHADVPAEIKSGKAPQPDGWGLPSAMLLTDSSCNVEQSITQQQLVLNIALCGGWCNDTFQSQCGASFPNATSCTDLLVNPRNYDNAYWKIKSITVWQ